MKKILIVLLLLLSACGKEERTDVVLDHKGNEVVVVSEANRLVSSYYITTSIALAFDTDEEFVGIDGRAKINHLYSLINKDLTTLPTTGTLKDFNVETAASLKSDVHYTSVRLKDNIDNLRQLGINVVAVDPETKEALYDTIKIVGKSLDKSKRANEIIEYLDKLEEKLEEQKTPKRAYLASSSSFYQTVGKNMYQNSLLEAAGLINVAYELNDSYHSKIDVETLLNYDPEVIIISQDYKYDIEELKADPVLSELSAFKNDQIYYLENEMELFDSPVMSSFLMPIYLQKEIYQTMSEEEYQEIFDDFYSFMYNI